MKKYLSSILLLLFGVTLFSDAMIGIYLFIIGLPILVAVKFSHLFGAAIVVLAVLKILKRHFEVNAREEG